MIIVKNRELLIPNNERYIGTTYDNDTENRVFQVPRFSQRGVDLANLTFRLDIQYANEAFDTVVLGKEVGETFIILIWKITSATLQVPGTLYIGIRAVDSEATVKWSSFSAAMYAERHLNTPGNYTGNLTEIEQMEQDHVYMKGVVDELKSNLDYAHDAEAWAQGTRSGAAVPSTDKTYHKNSKYYSEQASAKATQAANSATAAANSATQAAETVTDTNTRFDNAVAAVTSETEVIDARVGADGTQYTVLKNRLDAEHNQLKENLFQSTPFMINVPPSDMTEKSDHFLIGGVESASSLWRIISIPVKFGEKYRITARYYSSIKCASFFDENGTFLSETGSSPDDTTHTIDVIVPANAVKMSINDKKTNTFAIDKYVYLLKTENIYVDGKNIVDIVNALDGVINGLGTKTGSNTWKISTDNYVYNVDLRGSANGTFKYVALQHNDVAFKNVADDITPISINGVNFVGANHGYNFGYKATKSAHGLTLADIGKTCEIDGNIWVLIQVDDTSHFTVVCKEDSNWFGVKYVDSAPTVFNFGTVITVTTIERVQIYPSVNNISVAVVENTSLRFVVTESYDIINLKTGLTAIIANVGENDNTSIANLSVSALTVRNVYEFYANGSCTIVQNLKINNCELSLNWYGGTQSARFSLDDYYAVPLTSADLPQAIGPEVNFYRSMWDDTAKPPVIYIQLDGTGANATRMFLQGIVMDDRNANISHSAGFVYPTGKMYPYAVSPISALPLDKTYNFNSFRIPMYVNEIDALIKFCGYTKVGAEYYFYCYNDTAVSKTITVPSELIGKKIDTILSKNAICINSIVSTGIDVKMTAEGYLLLMLSA